MYETLKFTRGGKFTSSGAWCHSERTIDTNEIIIVTEGEVHMFVGDEKFTLLPGDVLKIEPGVRHGGTKKSDHAAFFWFHFKLFEPLLTPTFSHPKNSERLFLITKELMHYAESEGYPPDCADCIARVILHEIEYKKEEEHRTVAEVKEWIRKNRTESVTAVSVAEHFGYNADYLNRLFKKHARLGLKEYINDTKLGYIRTDLMMGGISLSEIAEKYGFPDYKYFSKYFKYHEGMTPAEYRKTYYKMHTN
jgi:YesN/AraC family two-component response regulator